jgi:hypothetical protein
MKAFPTEGEHMDEVPENAPETPPEIPAKKKGRPSKSEITPANNAEILGLISGKVLTS